MASDAARTEIHKQWESLRHEVMQVLAKKEAALNKLMDDMALAKPEPLQSQSSHSPRMASLDQRSAGTFSVDMEDHEDHKDFFKDDTHEEMMQKWATKATSGRTFRQEQGLRQFIQQGTHLGMFVDRTGCRSFLERGITKVEYLRSLHEPPRTGCLARCVDSSSFQFVCTVVILANCLTLFFSANWAMEHKSFEIPLELRFLDLSFTSFYVVELFLKLAVHRQYFFWTADWRWNVFDFVLVVLAVQEQVLEYMAASSVTCLSYMRSLRLVRVSRILRLLRAIRVIRELRMMVFSIMSSLNALFWCLVLVSLVICVFALFFLQIVTDYLVLEEFPEDEAKFLEFFGSLALTMQTLYMATTGGFDWKEALDLVAKIGEGGILAFLFYIAFFNFAVFNVLTGMFVDHAMKWSQSDNQNQIAERRSQEQHDAHRLKRLCEAIDVAKTGRISWDDFESYVSNESALIYLASLGLEIHDAKTFFDMLLGVADDKYVDIDTFVKGCMRMKGPATSIDMLSMGYEVTLIHRQNRRLEETINEVCDWQRKVHPLLEASIPMSI